jgi:type 1 glutamine amidotransferase
MSLRQPTSWSRRIRVAVVATACTVAWASAARADEAVPLRVCLVSGSLEYKSNKSLADFQKFVEAAYPVRCTRAFVEGEDIKHLAGLENLDACDTMLLFTRRLKLSGEQLERIKRYCSSGRPLVGVRTASHAIQTWLELDREVLNGNYHSHYGEGPPTQISIAAGTEGHPILAGFAPYRSAGSLYKNSPLPSGNEVLLIGTIPDHSEPIAWTHMHKGGRIFYTALGHPQDFAEASFRRLLVNALFWTAGRATPTK